MYNNLFKLLPKVVDYKFTPHSFPHPRTQPGFGEKNVKKFCLHLFITLGKCFELAKGTSLELQYLEKAFYYERKA